MYLQGFLIDHFPLSQAPPSEKAPCKHGQFLKILELFDYIEERYNVFDLYPSVDRALEGKVMSVSEDYRGAGVCKELTRRTMEHMQANDLHLYHVMCSSDFSSKLCERLGFRETYSLKYSDYVINGVHPVMPAAPHDAYRAFAKIVR